MARQQIRDFFQRHSLFFSRLGFENDPPRLDEQGRLIEFRQDYDGYAELHAKMHQTGVKAHTGLLFSGWIGPDTYDYTLTDDTLHALFSKLPPDALYLPRVKLNPPVEWQKLHPEELFVYWGGDADPEHLRPLVGTLKQDLLGLDLPDGYWLDKRPNVGGMFSNQSFSSDLWVRDGQRALVALIRHLKESPYADRIIGVHIGYGACGETCWWGRCSSRHGDYSRVFAKAFLDWGTKKYGSEAERDAAWGTTELPSPDQLILDQPETIEAYLRRRPQDRICIDRDLYVSQRNAAVCEAFCQTVKSEDPSWCTGVFYGYILECSNANYSGWLGIEQLLDSPSVDFLAAPCSYYRREEGESGGYLVPAQSVNRKKIFLDELDIRTYLATQENSIGIHAIPQACTRSVLCREMCKNLMTESGFWWMDLGGTYYNSDFMRQEIRYVERLAASIRSLHGAPCADVLQLVSEESYACHTESAQLFGAYRNCERELTLAGALVDTYRLHDLASLDLSRYKLIILRDCVCLTPEQRALLKNFSGVLFTTYLDGMGNGQPLAVPVAESPLPFPPGTVTFSGIFSGTTSIGEWKLPRIMPSSHDWSSHASFADGSPAIVSQDGRRFLSLLPMLTWQQFRELIDYAGCRTYGEAPCTVYGNTAFTAVFSHRHPEQFSLVIDGKTIQ